MARFRGIVTLRGRRRSIEVWGDPHRVQVFVDGFSVVDRRPFVARDRVHFELSGEPLTLLWIYPSPLHLECALVVGGVTTALSEVSEDGVPRPPLREADRRRLWRRTFGIAGILVGLMRLWFVDDSLRRGSYDAEMLFSVPVFLLGGLFALFWPQERSLPRGAHLAAVIAALLLFLAASLLVARWSLARFVPAPH